MRIELTMRRAESLPVESVPLRIPRCKWMTVHATPHIDAEGRVTDLWGATEVSTGACLPITPASSIPALVRTIREWVTNRRIDKYKWDRMVARTRLFKARLL